MAVKNIECQLAEMQIGRYVSGEPFSQEAVRQLEAHVAKCPRCADILNDRKAALRAMLQKEPRAVVSAEKLPRFAADDNPLLKALREKAPAAASKKPVGAGPLTGAPSASALEQLLRKGLSDSPRTESRANDKSVRNQQSTVNNPQWLRSYWKPIALSGALAIVMIAMSWMSRDQGNALFGDNADKLPAKIDATGVQPVKKTAKNLRPKKNPATSPPAGSTSPGSSSPSLEGEGDRSDTNSGATSDNTLKDNPKAPAMSGSPSLERGGKGVGELPKHKPGPATQPNSEGDESDNSVQTPVHNVHRVHHVHHAAPKPEPRAHHRQPAPKPHHTNSIKVYSPDGDPM